MTLSGKRRLSAIFNSLLAFVVLTSSYAAEQTVEEPVQPRTAAGSTDKPERPVSEKEAAFRKFYKRDPACDSFKDDNMMDRCRHAYTTAKKEFEKIWAARKDTP